MNLLLDMNLPRSWVGFLNNAGHDAVHWASVGDPRAEDVEIMEYARSEARVVFTHDLDFGMLLALTRGAGPSVLQVRTQNVFPEAIGRIVLNALRSHEEALASGALVTVDERAARLRLLPIR